MLIWPLTLSFDRRFLTAGCTMGCGSAAIAKVQFSAAGKKHQSFLCQYHVLDMLSRGV